MSVNTSLTPPVSSRIVMRSDHVFKMLMNVPIFPEIICDVVGDKAAYSSSLF